MPLYNPASTVTDATISTSDITTNNASTSKHGWLLKLDNNAAHYLDGQGGWTTPGGTTPAGTELDYAQTTSATTVTATTEGTANTVVTGNSVAYDGATIVLIEFYAESVDTDASLGAQVTIVLYDGASSIGKMALIIDSATGALYTTTYVARRLTPSNASHTYSIRAYTSTGTAHVNAGAGGSGNIMPAFIRISAV